MDNIATVDNNQPKVQAFLGWILVLPSLFSPVAPSQVISGMPITNTGTTTAA